MLPQCLLQTSSLFICDFLHWFGSPQSYKEVWALSNWENERQSRLLHMQHQLDYIKCDKARRRLNTHPGSFVGALANLEPICLSCLTCTTDTVHTYIVLCMCYSCAELLFSMACSQW